MMCNKKNSLQVNKRWKFTLAKISEMSKTKSKKMVMEFISYIALWAMHYLVWSYLCAKIF